VAGAVGDDEHPGVPGQELVGRRGRLGRGRERAQLGRPGPGPRSRDQGLAGQRQADHDVASVAHRLGELLGVAHRVLAAILEQPVEDHDLGPGGLGVGRDVAVHRPRPRPGHVEVVLGVLDVLLRHLDQHDLRRRLGRPRRRARPQVVAPQLAALEDRRPQVGQDRGQDADRRAHQPRGDELASAR
jgi:hypothetical protein